jgi:membrane-associated phospholipid phosphatase
MSRKATIIYACSAVTVFLALLILASFFDFDISKRLAVLENGQYYSSDAFARWMEIFGEMPLYLFLCYAISVIFWNAVCFGKPIVKYSLGAICIILLACVCYYIPDKIHHYFLELNETVVDGRAEGIVLDILVAVGIGSISIVGVLFTGKSRLKKQLSFAVVIISVALFSQLFTQGLKIVNKRVRFRAMNVLEDFSYFTPWYKINGYPQEFRDLVSIIGFGDAIKSFPSGHTTAAGITYSLIAVPYVFKRFNDKLGKTIFYIVSIAYTGLVAYSRIRMGAHYFSDVLVGGSVAFLFAALSVWIIYIKKAIKPLNRYCFTGEEI